MNYRVIDTLSISILNKIWINVCKNENMFDDNNNNNHHHEQKKENMQNCRHCCSG